MLSRSLFGPASVLLSSLLASPATAQLTTSCNPTEKTCPEDAAFGADYTFYFNSTPDSTLWKSEAGTVTYDSENGAALTIPKRGYSPTLMTQFYFFWGRTEVIMKTANGTGICSSIVYGSDDLDEVDWEFLGGYKEQAQTNYYGKGVTTVYDHGANFNTTSSVQTEWHNYTNVWTEDKLEWWLDGALVRTLLPADANDTWSYPQTPMTLRLGIWAAGDANQSVGTIEWAGGETDYSQAPFTMYVKSVRITDYSKGTAYNYTDRSGNGSSIAIINPGANSTAYNTLFNPVEASTGSESVSEKWNSLNSTTKFAIYAACGGVAFVGLGLFALYYFNQRSRGKREAAELAEQQAQERMELERFQKEGRSPDDLSYTGTEYNPQKFGAPPAGATASAGGFLGPAAAGYTAVDTRSNSLNSAIDMHETTTAWDPMSNSGSAPVTTGPASPLLHDGPGSPVTSSNQPTGGLGSPVSLSGGNRDLTSPTRGPGGFSR